MTVTEPLDDEALRDRLVELTRDLVIIPSTSSRPDERERCYQFVRNHIDVIEGLDIGEYRRGGYPSLVALPAGCDEPEVLALRFFDSLLSFKMKELRIHGVEDGLEYLVIKFFVAV